MNLVLQGDDLIPLVLYLLDILLLLDFLLEHGALIQLDELLEVHVPIARLLGQLQQAQILALLDLNAALGLLDFLLNF